MSHLDTTATAGSKSMMTPQPSHSTLKQQEQRPFGEWLPDPKPDYSYPPVHSLKPYGHVPVDDPTRTVHGMFIPASTKQCACCPHHHKRKDANRILYRHAKKQTWFQYTASQFVKAWEFLKMSYWHIEPWVVRPLIAGLAFNIGIQIARVTVQALFPSYFPTTVYLPLRANAQFYDLHSRSVVPSEASTAVVVRPNADATP